MGHKAEIVKYSIEEHAVWKTLYNQQIENLKNKAICKFFDYVNLYDLPSEYIPQLSEISLRLKKQTGWEIIRVEGLIDTITFFQLLANKKFPSTVNIRKRSELEISKDPDVFHEIFGHTVLLMEKEHAHYIQMFGKIALTLNKIELRLLQRLFWFTYEVGLIQTCEGVRIYGGSILSSLKESNHALNIENVNKKPFSILDILRTPYRADELQKSYYILDSFQTLFNILDNREYLVKKIWEAYFLGEFPSEFMIDDSLYISVNCCQRILSEERIGKNRELNIAKTIEKTLL